MPKPKYKLSIAPNGMITYWYRPYMHCVDGMCKYHLLCEVGEMYQQWFKDQIKRHGYTIKSGDAPAPIHWADYVQK